MSKKTLGNLLAILLICIAIFPNLPNIPIPNPIPKPAVNLDVSKPTQDILDKVNSINTIITDHNDRIKLAVFNYCFSKRVPTYSIDTQKLNDIYVKAAEYYFSTTMQNKYDNLDTELKKMFVDIVGSENHTLSEDEKVQLKNTFGGLAWSLIQ